MFFLYEINYKHKDAVPGLLCVWLILQEEMQ